MYVQHLLGIGHLKRAATLARAMRSAGFELTLASGGAPVAGIEVHQLPPASSPDFKQLLDEHGKPVDDAWKERRTAALINAWRRSHADALIVEDTETSRELLEMLLRSWSIPPVSVATAEEGLA